MGTPLSSLLLYSVLLVHLACTSTQEQSKECYKLFNGSGEAFDYSVDRSKQSDNVFFASDPVLRVIPREIAEEMNEKLFNSLFRERLNTRSYVWTHSQREDHAAAAILHIISCSAENALVKDNKHRRSFCSGCKEE